MVQPRSPRDLARRHAASAVETLQTISAYGKSEMARIAAAVALLEFGHGRMELKPVSPNGETDLDGVNAGTGG